MRGLRPRSRLVARVWPHRGGGTATTLEWGNGLHGLLVAAVLMEPSDLGSGDELMLLPCYCASTL
mgnify:CR=1 FL=1